MSKENILRVENFQLDSGDMLPTAEFFYKTYGSYRTNRSNAILVFHALTGNANAGDWWSGIIGEGKPIDPEKHFIICANFLGSCYGSSGPQSEEFPVITTRDIARQHLAILDSLGINKVAIGIGGSMGGMVLLELAILAPDLFEKIIPISVSASHSAWRIAFSSVIRKTIEKFGQEFGVEGYKRGMHLARQIAMATYRSSTEFDGRFGRNRKDEEFEIENYLEYQGEKIVARFSPHSYITLTRAMELYDISDSLSEITSDALFIGATSDVLYSEREIKATARSITGAKYKSLDAPFGHDSFLVAQEKLGKLIAPFVNAKVKHKEEVFA